MSISFHVVSAATATEPRSRSARTFGRHVRVDGDRFLVRSFDGRCYLYQRQYVGPAVARSKFKDTYIGRIHAAALSSDVAVAATFVRAALAESARAEAEGRRRPQRGQARRFEHKGEA